MSDMSEFQRLHLNAYVPSRKPIYVVSHSMRAARDYIDVAMDECWFQGIERKPVAVFDAQALRGLRTAEVHLVGLYRWNNDWERIRLELMHRRLDTVEVFHWRGPEAGITSEGVHVRSVKARPAQGSDRW